jgi:hypothetical protein
MRHASIVSYALRARKFHAEAVFLDELNVHLEDYSGGSWADYQSKGKPSWP